MAQVALAWLLSRSGLTAPIVGATKLPQLEDALAAVSVKLAPEDSEELDKSYTWNRQLGLLQLRRPGT
jgi:aryl-alcohol dehydrogenase-like predicted oxidoreductase